MSNLEKPVSAEVSVNGGPFVNIAAYRFTHLDRLSQRRTELSELCRSLQLRGTILLSPEGINLFLAGQRAAVDEILAALRSDSAFADLEVKESLSDQQPFHRMLVKIKKEIIPFGVPDLLAPSDAAPKLAPEELLRSLSAGEDVVLLDVRNDYEIRLGTFRGAMALGIDHFRDFPQAVQQLPAAYRERKIVMFCTGGIRCEKAGPYLREAGFSEVYQLEGGILKYFEKCGGAYYQGECFVFDQRVAVNSQLIETDTVQCFACQAPITAAQQRQGEYERGVSCPHCYRTPAQRQHERLQQRQARLAEVSSPLPGSRPYHNIRPINVPRAYHGWQLDQFLAAYLPAAAEQQVWRRALNEGRWRRDGEVLRAEHTVAAGQRIEHHGPSTVEPDVRADITIVHEDDALIVVHKPASLPMHPSGRFNRNTLQYLLDQVYAPQRLRIVHRLDANTSGLTVLARHRRAAAQLHALFAQQRVEKYYLVRVQGTPEWDHFESQQPIDRGPSSTGARVVCHDGLDAHTEFNVLRRLADGTTLLRARPLTGRTNQIRVHLWDLGLSVCGDPTYLPDHHLGSQQTLHLDQPPLMLHAWKLSFPHPAAGQPVSFEAPAPDWASGSG